MSTECSGISNAMFLWKCGVALFLHVMFPHRKVRGHDLGTKLDVE